MEAGRAESAERRGASPELKTAEDKLLVSGDGFAAAIDKTSGALVSYHVDGVELLAAPARSELLESAERQPDAQPLHAADAALRRLPPSRKLAALRDERLRGRYPGDRPLPAARRRFRVSDRLPLCAAMAASAWKPPTRPAKANRRSCRASASPGPCPGLRPRRLVRPRPARNVLGSPDRRRDRDL